MFSRTILASFFAFALYGASDVDKTAPTNAAQPSLADKTLTPAPEQPRRFYDKLNFVKYFKNHVVEPLAERNGTPLDTPKKKDYFSTEQPQPSTAAGSTNHAQDWWGDSYWKTLRNRPQWDARNAPVAPGTLAPTVASGTK